MVSKKTMILAGISILSGLVTLYLFSKNKQFIEQALSYIKAYNYYLENPLPPNIHIDPPPEYYTYYAESDLNLVVDQWKYLVGSMITSFSTGLGSIACYFRDKFNKK